jgi:DNA invertase Pin-like site-specific DNA recombinase
MTGQNIGYIRVSTIEQNTSRQLEGLTLHKTFTDKCSGKDTNRPQLEALLDFIREGDTLYVHSMDRLARNLDDLRKLVTKLNKKQIKIHFIKENLIFSGEDSPMAKFMLSVMGAFAEFERDLINERIREGVAIAKAAGKYKGRTKICNQGQIDDIRSMVANRYKITEIAKKYGVTRTTIYRYLEEIED